jgi:threonine/homoserine/homoserine lactone efflux protein
LSYLIAQSAALFTAVRWAGAAYLIYLGIRTLTSGRADSESAAVQRPLRSIFLEGIVVNLLNPKTILFFLAFLPQFVDPVKGSAALQIMTFGLILATIGLTSDLMYAVAASALGERLRRRARLLKYVSGLVYLVLGLATAFSGSARRSG